MGRGIELTHTLCWLNEIREHTEWEIRDVKKLNENQGKYSPQAKMNLNQLKWIDLGN